MGYRLLLDENIEHESAIGSQPTAMTSNTSIPSRGSEREPAMRRSLATRSTPIEPS